MSLAESLAERSTCSRLKVGCVITSTDHRYVYAVGYNGGAAGQQNECESDQPGQCGHIHAEMNAIINCCVPRETKKVVYITNLPCVMCSKSLVNLGGIVRLIYRHDYRIRDGLEILARAGIEIVRMNEEIRDE